MHPKLRVTLVLALGVLLSVASMVLAVRDTSGQVPSATIVSPDSTPTTYYVRDMDGRIVTVEVPSMGPPDLKVSDPAQGTVQATVMAVDGEMNRVKVQTQEGQTLMLDLPRESVVGMRVGDQFTLRIAQPSRQ